MVELARSTAAGCAVLLLLAAAVLCWRRLAGGLSRPLEPPLLLAAAVCFAVAVAAVRTAQRCCQEAQIRCGRLDWIVAGILSVAVFMMGAALSLPDTSPGALLVLWGVLATEEVWAWRPWRRLRERKGDGSLFDKAGRRKDPNKERLPSPFLPDDVLQQLTRSRTADGSEVLSGWIRVPLAAGQRSTNVHIAFCPPFPRTPRASVEQLEGPEARIKTAQLLPYGARFDLKLASQSDSPVSLLLQFSAEGESPAQSVDT